MPVKSPKVAALSAEQVKQLNVLLAADLPVHQAARRMGMSYEVLRLSLALGKKDVGRQVVDVDEKAALASQIEVVFSGNQP